jgi:hypothetical protein
MIPDTPCPVTWVPPATLVYDDERTNTAIDVRQRFLRGHDPVNSSSQRNGSAPSGTAAGG